MFFNMKLRNISSTYSYWLVLWEEVNWKWTLGYKYIIFPARPKLLSFRYWNGVLGFPIFANISLNFV